MKFARTFQQHLLEDGFPEHWTQSAISYRKLKKCIKKVEQELADIGLDAETLSLLLATAEKGSPTKNEDGEKPFKYSLSVYDDDGKAASGVGAFRPKLQFTIDSKTGEPLHATLTPETRQYLHELALREKLSTVRITEEDTLEATDSQQLHPKDGVEQIDPSSSQQAYSIVEVPLISDSHFFSTLQSELSGLAALQKAEEKRLAHEIQNLGTAVSKMTNPTSSRSKHDLTQWRKIFEMYLDSRIFFSTAESDTWAHDSARAAKEFGIFGASLQKEGLTTNFKQKEGAAALHQFIQINQELLQSLRFQEINTVATTKILKKFDKRTALGVTPASTPLFAASPIPHSLARAVCAELSGSLLATVPQLNDYSCPICLSLAWRPVRLNCGHTFCIRCLIVMQRAKQDACPLCRQRVVMKADSDNIDTALAKLMKRYFAKEVKEKQRSNERAAAIDIWGVHYDDDTKCAVM